ncbi:hypothetical protein V2J09_006224 [Rumex salicifolius]
MASIPSFYDEGSIFFIGVGCRKGLHPIGNHLWCESCGKPCEYPLLRYRLHLEVKDDTTTLVVTLFDDEAEAIMRKKATVLMQEMGENTEEAGYPEELADSVSQVAPNEASVVEVKETTTVQEVSPTADTSAVVEEEATKVDVTILESITQVDAKKDIVPVVTTLEKTSMKRKSAAISDEEEIHEGIYKLAIRSLGSHPAGEYKENVRVEILI